MKLRPIETTPEQVIAVLPVVHQDEPTITRLRAELRRICHLLAVPGALGLLNMVLILGGGGLMMVLMKIYPALADQSNQSGTPMRAIMLLLFAAIALCILGFLGLPVVLPVWIDRRIRGREAVFCDPQLIDDIIDLGQAIQAGASGLQRGGWYTGCVPAWLTRILPEIGPLEAAALTNKQRDFLAERALAWQSEAEAFVLAILRSAPVWGDVETLAALLMISQNAESDAIRAAAHAGLSPLKLRLQANREDAVLVNSLAFPYVP
jgi:hypothetical protein